MIELVSVGEQLLEAVLAIENYAFSPPWPASAFYREMDVADALFEAAVENGEVLGYCILHESGDEGEIFKIAVRESSRRRGIADMLMSSAVEHAKKRGLTQIFLEVRESNAPAIALYEKSGFAALGKRKKYYIAPVEDAVVMSKQLEV